MIDLDDAIALQQSGKLKEAAEAYLAIFDSGTEDARLPEEAGNIYLYHLQRPLDAVPCYEKALKLVEDPTELLHRIGFAYASSGDDDRASDWYAKAHESDPTHPQTFLEVGKLCMRAGRYQDAVEYLQTAVVHHTMQSMLSGGPNPHFIALVALNRARVYLVHTDQVQEGLTAMAHLYDELGDFTRGCTLARELIAASKHDRARLVLDAILKRVPDHGDALALKASL